MAARLRIHFGCRGLTLCDGMKIRATQLRPGDRLEDLGRVTKVAHDGDLVIFYVHEETGGFTMRPDDEVDVERDDERSLRGEGSEHLRSTQ